MATKTPAKTDSKKRQLKPAETIRQKANKTASKPKQLRRLRRTAGVISRPFKALGRLIGLLLRPFRFMLAPFKTRPMRAVGRFLASVLLLRYFRNSWGELRKVEWPNARETAKLTLAVFVFAIFFSLLISLADFGLDKLFKNLIIK